MLTSEWPLSQSWIYMAPGPGLHLVPLERFLLCETPKSFRLALPQGHDLVFNFLLNISCHILQSFPCVPQSTFPVFVLFHPLQSYLCLFSLSSRVCVSLLCPCQFYMHVHAVPCSCLNNLFKTVVNEPKDDVTMG